MGVEVYRYVWSLREINSFGYISSSAVNITSNFKPQFMSSNILEVHLLFGTGGDHCKQRNGILVFKC